MILSWHGCGSCYISYPQCQILNIKNVGKAVGSHFKGIYHIFMLCWNANAWLSPLEKDLPWICNLDKNIPESIWMSSEKIKHWYHEPCVLQNLFHNYPFFPLRSEKHKYVQDILQRHCTPCSLPSDHNYVLHVPCHPTTTPWLFHLFASYLSKHSPCFSFKDGDTLTELKSVWVVWAYSNY